MTKKNLNTNVFAVINLANPKQEKVARYAAELAKSLGLGLVLYPNNYKAGIPFTEGFCSCIEIANTITDVPVKVSKKETNIVSIFTSLHDIAEKENAALMTMGVEKEFTKDWGKAIWSVTQKVHIPTLLLPYGSIFKPFDTITIAVDSERKLKKMYTVMTLAKAFNSRIKIFIERPGGMTQNHLVQASLRQIKEYLDKYKIPYDLIEARETKNFPEHIRKYAKKYSDLLILEVDTGSINKVVKQNIEMLTSLDTRPGRYPKPVLLTKTMDGNYANFA